MATVHVVNGSEVKERNPWGVWGLTLITLGIYQYVWYYKINKELRRTYDIEVDPAMTVLALTLGSIVIIPPFVAIYRTGRRIERAQSNAGVSGRISPVLHFILALLFSFNLVYGQSNLNKMWRQSARELPSQPSEALPSSPQRVDDLPAE